MYKLNPKSNSAKFFKWMWGKSVTKYKTMCPYFWQYVLTILTAPITIPFRLLVAFAMWAEHDDRMYISKSCDNVGRVFKKIPTPSTKFMYYAEMVSKWLLIGIVALIFVALNYVIFMEKGLLFGLGMYGLFIGALGVIFLVIVIVSYFVDWKEQRDLEKWESFTMEHENIPEKVTWKDTFAKIWRKLTTPFRLTGDMIVVLYKQHCPRIEWVE